MVTDEATRAPFPTWSVVIVVGLAVALFALGDGLIVWLIVAGLYFAPLIVALTRRHHQRGAIAVVNTLLGWTFIGWVVALAMACSAVKA